MARYLMRVIGSFSGQSCIPSSGEGPTEAAYLSTICSTKCTWSEKKQSEATQATRPVDHFADYNPLSLILVHQCLEYVWVHAHSSSVECLAYKSSLRIPTFALSSGSGTRIYLLRLRSRTCVGYLPDCEWWGVTVGGGE